MVEELVVIGVVLGAAILALHALRGAFDSTAGGCSCGFQCNGAEQPLCHDTVDQPEERHKNIVCVSGSDK